MTPQNSVNFADYFSLTIPCVADFPASPVLVLSRGPTDGQRSIVSPAAHAPGQGFADIWRNSSLGEGQFQYLCWYPSSGPHCSGAGIFLFCTLLCLVTITFLVV